MLPARVIAIQFVYSCHSMDWYAGWEMLHCAREGRSISQTFFFDHLFGTVLLLQSPSKVYGKERA